jgi:hypothetical protein
MENAKTAMRRCAIYTRTSPEEGLEQNFNSLQVQREACEAFIKSQDSEGWRLIETAYDDGGFSGEAWSGPRFSGCWRISKMGAPTGSLSTRSIG